MEMEDCLLDLEIDVNGEETFMVNKVIIMMMNLTFLDFFYISLFSVLVHKDCSFFIS